MPRALMVVSHPDDELIFGAALLLDKTVEKKVLVCSSDENNPARRWCAHRKEAFYEVCDSLGIRDRKVLPFDSEFSKANHRNGLRSDILEEVSTNVKLMSAGCDFVFTHNAFGEYGHTDHVATWEAVVRSTDLPVVTTDVLMKLDWTPFGEVNANASSYLGKTVCERKIDAAEYKKSEDVYRKRGVWTWCRPMVETVRLVSHSDLSIYIK